MPGNITIRCDRDGCPGHITDERALYFLVEDPNIKDINLKDPNLKY